MDARIEKVLNLPRYQRGLIVVLLLAVIAAGFYYFVYEGQLVEHERLTRQKGSVSNKLRQSQVRASNLDKFKSEYEELQAKLNAALVKLPKKQEIPTLLTSIGALAKEQGLNIVSFKPENEIPKGFYAEVPVALKMHGSYHQVALFFEAIGNMSRIVNIQGLELAQPKVEREQTVLSVNCKAITFRFVENPPPPPQKGKK